MRITAIQSTPKVFNKTSFPKYEFHAPAQSYFRTSQALNFGCACKSSYTKTLSNRGKELAKRIDLQFKNLGKDAAKNEQQLKKLGLVKLLLPNLDRVNEIPKNAISQNAVIKIIERSTGKLINAEIRDLLPFSDIKEYEQISKIIEEQWKKAEKSYPDAHILSGIEKLNPKRHYCALWAGGELQGLASVEIQSDKKLWLRELNSAPWNQGENAKYKGVGTGLLARAVGIGFECDYRKVIGKPYPILGLRSELYPETVNYYRKIPGIFEGRPSQTGIGSKFYPTFWFLKDGTKKSCETDKSAKVFLGWYQGKTS